MERYFGKSIYEGIAAGPVFVLNKEDQRAEQNHVEDPEAEIARVRRSLQCSAQELQALSRRAMEEAGEAGAAIFEAHCMMLEDEEYQEAICGMIRRESVAAEYAVTMTGDRFAERFAGMEDAYLKARAVDVRDISQRLLSNLKEGVREDFQLPEPAIIVANDLTPGETLQLDREKILAFVTVQGSVNSHTAILARMLGIPGLVGVPMELSGIQTGMMAVVDAGRGEIIFEPDASLWAEAECRVAQERERKHFLQALKGKDNVTRSGRRVEVCANISGIGDVASVLENDAAGIGLFRSEFLYLGRDSFPSEEEQFQTYKQVLQAMGEKKVIIRTVDLGADKQAAYFHLDREENPALGYRGIRICLGQPDIFKTQLRALLRASVYGNLSVMYPMIISVKEVEEIQKIVEEVQRELELQGIPFRLPRQGLMIETPAAVMISHRLAQIVDFFSIGTNDLTQYTLALDRQNGRLADFYDPHHEAILQMIQIVVDNAHKYGKWVGICGELAADLELTPNFVEMGVDELSVPPAMILPLRGRIREL